MSLAKKQFLNERTCIVCKQKETKAKLLRFVLDKQNVFSFDKEQKLEGRGAYVHYSKECLNFSGLEKLLKKSLKTSKDFKDDLDKLKESLLEKIK